jgi:CRISPR-associated exonuclease Cas4
MAPRYLRYADAAREALHHDTGLVLARPSTAAASARDQFDPPHVRDVATTSVRLAFKLTLKPNVKIIAHGSPLRHNPDITDMWEGSPAYGQSELAEIEHPSPQPAEPLLPSAANDQTAAIFVAELERIDQQNPRIEWHRPSLADVDRELLDRATIDIGADEGDSGVGAVVVGAGALRGIVLHKLMEELLTEQLPPNLAHLTERASTLSQEAFDAGSLKPDPLEMATTALRTFSHSELMPYVRKLVPEVPLFGARSETVLVSARADAIAFEVGIAVAAFDWKSDIAPTEDDHDAYASQLLEYLELIGAEKGAVVYMTSGEIRWVRRNSSIEGKNLV